MRINVYSEEFAGYRVTAEEKFSDGVKYIGIRLELKSNVFIGSKGSASSVTFWLRDDEEEIFRFHHVLQDLGVALVNHVAGNPPEKSQGAAASLCQSEVVPEMGPSTKYEPPRKTDAYSTRTVTPTKEPEDMPVEIPNPKGPVYF